MSVYCILIVFFLFELLIAVLKLFYSPHPLFQSHLKLMAIVMEQEQLTPWQVQLTPGQVQLTPGQVQLPLELEMEFKPKTHGGGSAKSS